MSTWPLLVCEQRFLPASGPAWLVQGWPCNILAALQYLERISQVWPLLHYGREPQPPQWQRQEVMRWIILYSIWELQYWLLSLEVDIGGANRELACEQQPHSTIGTLHFWQNQTQVKCSTEIIVIVNWGFHHSVCSVYTGSLTSRFSK